MKLCLYKVTKSDACIRSLFANPVTYGANIQYLALRSCSMATQRLLLTYAFTPEICGQLTFSR